jgi:periplasmic divalent cation tolerance protein
MSAHDDVVVVLSTAPASADGSKRGAHELAEALLRERLCACVNVVPGLVSHYWWQGALDRSDEALLVIKTAHSRVAELKDRLVSLHPYELPEVLVLETSGGHVPYLDWVRRELISPQDRAPEASA